MATKTTTVLHAAGPLFVPDGGVKVGADQATATMSAGFIVVAFDSNDGGTVTAFVRRLAGTTPAYNEDKYHRVITPGVPHKFDLQPGDFLFPTLQLWLADGGNLVNLSASIVTVP